MRAVRHYHAKGLLPEPERDHSGYRRYDAAAVVDLIRIRTLADAGVPLSRVRGLLVADDVAFAAAVEEIDRSTPTRGDPGTASPPEADCPARRRRQPCAAAGSGHISRAAARCRRA